MSDKLDPPRFGRRFTDHPQFRDQAQFERDFAETKRKIARSQQRFETVIFAVCLVVMGVLLFGCWCVYHVLKAKRLL